MLRNILVVPAVVAVLLFSTGSAFALGVYADLPVQYTFSDCSNDCSKTPSGLKAGVVVSNVGFGVNRFSVEPVTGTTVDFTMVDLSYLLPIPVVNLTVGAGAGAVAFDGGTLSETGTATALWASFGIPIIPLLDVHVGYHQVSARTDTAGKLGGTLWSLGILLNL